MDGIRDKGDQGLPSLARQVRLWRAAQGLTQSRLETEAGLSHNTISRIECGAVSPRLETLERISKALGISVEQLQFQQPGLKRKENQENDTGEGDVDQIARELEKLPEPQRKMLTRSILDLIRIVTDEQDD